MATELDERIAGTMGAAVNDRRPLTGGCVGEVYRVSLADGRTVVAKVDQSADPRLDVEGYMLQYLADHSDLPVPAVYFSEPRLLLMEFLAGSSRFNDRAERHAAELLAALHACTADRFGLERDTLIGGLHQPNPWASSWVDFFREYRVLAMARQAMEAGRLGKDTMRRIERFCEKLDELLQEPPAPALLHGDVWSANVLAEGDRVTGFIDPAVYYGHPEIELAFITLFGTFGDAFFRPYNDLRPIEEGFSDLRRDIYNVYPLLVHVRLFGGHYLDGVEQVLQRHGC